MEVVEYIETKDHGATIIIDMEDKEIDGLLKYAIDKILQEKPQEQIDYLLSYAVNSILSDHIKFLENNEVSKNER